MLLLFLHWSLTNVKLWGSSLRRIQCQLLGLLTALTAQSTVGFGAGSILWWVRVWSFTDSSARSQGCGPWVPRSAGMAVVCECPGTGKAEGMLAGCCGIPGCLEV